MRLSKMVFLECLLRSTFFNITDTWRGPRAMRVFLPLVHSSGEIMVFMAFRSHDFYLGLAYATLMGNIFHINSSKLLPFIFNLKSL